MCEFLSTVHNYSILGMCDSFVWNGMHSGHRPFTIYACIITIFPFLTENFNGYFIWDSSFIERNDDGLGTSFDTKYKIVSQLHAAFNFHTN